MSEVSWDSKYSIYIEGMDIEDIENIRDALAEKAAKLALQTPAVFNKIIEICDNISKVDDNS